MYSQSLYAGGRFSHAGGQPASNIAKWGGASWLNVSSGVTGGVGDDGVHALNVNSDSSIAQAGDSDLYVGGYMEWYITPQKAVWNIARWDISSSSWSSLWKDGYWLSGVDDGVLALVGMAGGKYANGVAKWDRGFLLWSALVDSDTNVNGISGRIYALTGIGDALYVGGEFYQAGGKSANNISKWDTVSSLWSSLGSGITGTNITVRALAVAPSLLIVKHSTAP